MLISWNFSYPSLLLGFSQLTNEGKGEALRQEGGGDLLNLQDEKRQKKVRHERDHSWREKGEAEIRIVSTS